MWYHNPMMKLSIFRDISTHHHDIILLVIIKTFDKEYVLKECPYVIRNLNDDTNSTRFQRAEERDSY